MSAQVKIESIETTIHLVRGQRVMLDADLAKVYGVTTTRLNEQFRRNRKRFPDDFAFVLTRHEFTDLNEVKVAHSEDITDLKSQIATSSLPSGPKHGGSRKVPTAFTEHGAIMLASVLKSSIAIDASVRVVRAFVRLREMVSANRELSTKLAELEKRLDGHDEGIANLFGAIRQLLAPQPAAGKREIGFHVRETSPRYRFRRKRI